MFIVMTKDEYEAQQRVYQHELAKAQAQTQVSPELESLRKEVVEYRLKCAHLANDLKRAKNEFAAFCNLVVKQNDSAFYNSVELLLQHSGVLGKDEKLSERTNLV